MKDIIDRDKEVQVAQVEDFQFNGKTYKEIHLSLGHINYDKAGNKRSDYGAEEVVELFVNAIDGIYLEEDGQKDNCSYFVFFSSEPKTMKKYKIIFYTEENKIFVRIITLFRTGEKL
ncbi:MAG: hypothetical protein WCG27_10890 [Pseudomonadota bacterium]